VDDAGDLCELNSDADGVELAVDTPDWSRV
jgi:hypothetical protein